MLSEWRGILQILTAPEFLRQFPLPDDEQRRAGHPRGSLSPMERGTGIHLSTRESGEWIPSSEGMTARRGHPDKNCLQKHTIQAPRVQEPVADTKHSRIRWLVGRHTARHLRSPAQPRCAEEEWRLYSVRIYSLRDAMRTGSIPDCLWVTEYRVSKGRQPHSSMQYCGDGPGNRLSSSLPRRAGATVFLGVREEIGNVRDPVSESIAGYAQVATFSPGTFLNSRMLLVIRLTPRDRACAAISRSSGPIGWPRDVRYERTIPYCWAA
jgi:hypothetical protein